MEATCKFYSHKPSGHRFHTHGLCCNTWSDNTMARIKTKAIILIACLILLTSFQVRSFAREITVGKGLTYSSITEALQVSNEGDTIVVKNGVYKENIVINKSVHLIGEENPVIEGDYRGDVVRIETDKASIKGFTIRESGVDLRKDESGIKVMNSEGVTIEENQLEDNIIGVYLYSSPNNIIRNNTSYGRADYTTEETNGTGSTLMYSKNIILKNNTFKDNLGPNGFAMLLKSLTDSITEENLIANNTVGIFMDDANRNVFTKNIFSQNGWAIDLFSSSNDNVLYANNFLDNTYQVMTDTDRTTNRFFKNSTGNYWSDYKGYNGYDLNGDGKGDIPYKPVKLLSYVMKRYPDLTVFLESPGLKALEFAERVLPVLNPVELNDPYPLMNPVQIEEDSK